MNMPKLNISSESFVILPNGYTDQLFISTLDTSFVYKLTNFEQIKLQDTLSSVKYKIAPTQIFAYSKIKLAPILPTKRKHTGHVI